MTGMCEHIICNFSMWLEVHPQHLLLDPSLDFPDPDTWLTFRMGTGYSVGGLISQCIESLKDI